MKTHKIFTVVISFMLLSSCSKWIDVKPTDRLAETVLFESKEGFLKALNGIYVEMSSPTLYGQFMTAGHLDAMGQYYMNTLTTQPFFYYMTYDYTQTVTKMGFEGVWQKTYSTVANINVLLEHIGTAPSVTLPEPYYGIVKGEALALRAFLHFDMLRLFGPAWSPESKDLGALPYYRDASRKISPLYSSSEVLTFILQDLQEAATLLQHSDPILTSGVGNTPGPDGTNRFSLRQYRLNYFATQALMARVHLWAGDSDRAGALARAIIDAVQVPGQEIFPFVTPADASNGTTPDRLFATEVMFAMYTTNRVNMHNELFSSAQLVRSRLAPNAGNTSMTRVDAMYDDKNDYRYKIWETETLIGTPLVTNQKYKDYPNITSRFMIPLIRVSELYLIAAESSATIGEANEYINRLRAKRNAFTLTLADQVALDRAITNEYRREFIGEGQQFFYYKRNGFTDIPNHAALTGNKVVTLSSYRVPLPESETALRNDVK